MNPVDKPSEGGQEDGIDGGAGHDDNPNPTNSKNITK